MKKTQLKNSIRTIRKNLVSWIAVSIVTMIGCGVFFATFFYAQSMVDRTREYFIRNVFEDYNIMASQGLNEEEIDEFAHSQGIKDAEGTWRLDSSGLVFGDRDIDVEVYGLTKRISLPELISGELPAKAGECALTVDTMEKYGIKLGDVVKLTPSLDLPEDFITSDTFTVTAQVNHSDNFCRGLSTPVYLAEESFNKEAMDGNYNYIRVDGGFSGNSSVISDDYSQKIDGMTAGAKNELEKIGKSHDQRVRDEANQKLQDAKKEADEKLSAARKNIKKAEKEIAKADDKIKEAKEKIADGEQEIRDNEKKLKKAKKKIRSAEKKRKKGKKKLKRAKKKLRQGKKRLKKEKKKLQKAGKTLRSKEKELAKKKKKLKKLEKAGAAPSQLKSLVSKAKKKLKQKKKEYKKAQKKLHKAEKKLSKKQREYRRAKKKVSRAKRMIRKGKKEVKEGEKKLKEAKKKLKEAKEELGEKEKQLAQAKKDLEEGKQEYEDKKAEAEKNIADAEQKIADIKDSAFIFITRNDIAGYVMFRDNIKILVKLSTVFVIIFMGIGAVVVLSTITIVIDNNKKLIGTMKAFGFRNREIIAEYLIFGTSAIAFGMFLSVCLSALLQQVICKQMGPMFVVKPLPFSFQGAVFVIIFVIELVIAIVTTVIGTVVNAVRYSAVELISGAAGGTKKKGKGLFTAAARRSRMGLYSRLIFRNMKTDAARVVASVVIIAGSCMMMGVGFTLNYAFNDMMQTSAREINHYDMEIGLTGRCEDGEYDDIKNFLTQKGIHFVEIRKQNSFCNFGTVQENASVITGPETIYPEYIELRTMDKKKLCNPSDQAILLGNKISEETGVKGGDRISIDDEDFKPVNGTVGGVCRNYLGRNVYLSPEEYKRMFSKEPEWNTLLIRLYGADKEQLEAELKKSFHHIFVDYPDQIPEMYESLEILYNVMVLVMIILSIVMSVFVLFNLVNIFVRRRQNELIIMGINGFSYNEQIGYLLRETLVTTFVGLAAGVITGCLMTDFLVRIVENEDTMFIRDVNPKAWLFAVILETVFALVINLYAFRKIKKLQITDINK